MSNCKKRASEKDRVLLVLMSGESVHQSDCSQNLPNIINRINSQYNVRAFKSWRGSAAGYYKLIPQHIAKIQKAQA